MIIFSVFKKPKQTKKGRVYRWYYSYTDPVSKKRPQKACRGCRTRREAEAYVRALSPESVLADSRALVKDIAKNMYIPGGSHIQRLLQLGRKIETPHTLLANRRLIERIIHDFGNRPLAGIKSPEVTALLIADAEHGGSWKSQYRRAFMEIYDEARWQGLNIPKPEFDRIIVHSRKPDVFSTEELNRLFVPENFPSETFFLLFLLCLSGGLRIGEALGVQRRQLLFDKAALIIDGFCRPNGERTNYNKTGSADNQRIRVTILPGFTLEKIRDYMLRNAITLDNAFVFTKDGKPIGNVAAYLAFRAALVKANIMDAKNKGDRKLCIHSLRYTYVTRMRRELPAETVQRAVGHMQTKMTDYYTNNRALAESLGGLAGVEAAADKLFQ